MPVGLLLPMDRGKSTAGRPQKITVLATAVPVRGTCEARRSSMVKTWWHVGAPTVLAKSTHRQRTTILTLSRSLILMMSSKYLQVSKERKSSDLHQYSST